MKVSWNGTASLTGRFVAPAALTLLASCGSSSPAPPVPPLTGGCASTSATTACDADWPRFRHDPANTGFNACETVLSPASVGGLQLKWEVPGGLSSPVVVDGRVFVKGPEGMQAFDAETGAELWRSPASADNTAVSVSDGAVYLVTGSAVEKRAVTDGRLLWSYAATNGTDNASNVVGGVVYTGTADDRVLALDAGSGALIWAFTVGSASGVIGGSPAVVDGAVYINTTSVPGELISLDAATGSLRWRINIGSASQVSPSVHNGVVFSATTAGAVYAVNAADGTTKWTAQQAPAVFQASPAVAYGKVYLSDWGNGVPNVYAYDEETGAVVWSASQPGARIASAAVANGVVYLGNLVTGAPNIVALDAGTGTQLWSYTSSGPVSSSPTVVGGVLYVGTDQVDSAPMLRAFALPKCNS